MKSSSQNLDQSRRITCVRCGAAFTCDLSGRCWCAGETVRLPMPREGEDCLCPACLRASAHGPDQSNP
ncbi:cysteine-rich CWC family protein [[Pseudomonas] carboxydohydrogena]|uniref:cysteine-rich CWC family protein n=1 Tax=Afipia carboxydohydrogena TaxID=290 RepID=UPI0023AF8BE4|nr:cysteine-rich CWC family protein [[Pseudomonas] carboxydohydrogena]